MLTFFRTNQQFLNILLLFYLAVMRASTFMHTSNIVPRGHGILTNWVYASFPPLSMSGVILAFFLIFFQATAINLMITRYRVATDISLLPGVFYCLFTSLMPDFLPLSSIILANTFLVLALYNLFDTYKNNYVAGRIFDAGLWLGIASLFHFSYIFLVVWGIICLGILRGIRFKEFLILIIGIIVPLFLMGVYSFWVGQMPRFMGHFFENVGTMSFVVYKSSMIYIKIGLVLLFLLLTIVASLQFFSRRNMTAQKYISMIYWLMLLCSIIIFTQKGIDINQLLLLAIPISVLLSMTFQRIAPAMAETLHMLLLMVALILQFEYLLV